MELIIKNCKLPEYYIKNIITFVMYKKNYYLLEYFDVNVVSMHSVLISLSYSYMKDESDCRYMMTNDYLECLHFNNLLDFFLFAEQEYMTDIPKLGKVCCETLDNNLFFEKELIEKWILDGFEPCYECYEKNNFKLYDYVLLNYPEKFGNLFSPIDGVYGYQLDRSSIYSYVNKLIYYIQHNNLDIESLHENKYISNFLYERYLIRKNQTQKLKSYIKVPKIVNLEYQFKYEIKKLSNSFLCSVTLPNGRIITGDITNYSIGIFYITAIQDKIAKIGFSRDFTANFSRLRDEIFYSNDIEEYENILDQIEDKNIFIINDSSYTNINIKENTIIYYYDRYKNKYVDISSYYNIIILLLNKKIELNDFIIILNGDYSIFNEPWLLEYLLPSINPIYEVVNVYSNIEDDLLQFMFIEFISNIK